MKAMHVPGAIVFVAVPGQGTWTATFGTSDLGTHAPMDVHIHMRIGSITKTLTGEVILQLADEGKLRLDDPVAKYQPAVPNGAHITIRELLNMTSGLYSYDDDPGFLKAQAPSRRQCTTPKTWWRSASAIGRTSPRARAGTTPTPTIDVQIKNENLRP